MSLTQIVHDDLFKRILPATFFNDSRIGYGLLALCEHGRLPWHLSEMWSARAAELVAEHGGTDDLDQVDSEDFTTVVFDSFEGQAALFIIPPASGHASEVEWVMAVYDGKLHDSEWRYFTCVASVERDGPGTFIEWLADGSRINRGEVPGRMFGEVFVSSFAEFIQMVCVETGFQLRPEFRGGWDAMYEMPEDDETLDSEEAPVITIASTWADSAEVIANEVLVNMDRIKGAGNYLILRGTATGLLQPVETFMQFIWNRANLQVEIKANYSYFGLAIPPAKARVFENCGLNLMRDQNGSPIVFFTKVPISASPDERLVAVSRAVGAFLGVLRPEGVIDFDAAVGDEDDEDDDDLFGLSDSGDEHDDGE